VTTVLLVRHGLTASTGRLLTGWTPGITLDDRGLAQAKALAERLAPVPLDAIVTSPLERCQQTAEAIASVRTGRGRAVADELSGATGERGSEARAVLAPGSAPGTPGAAHGAPEAERGLVDGRAGSSAAGQPVVDDRVGECRYGDWTGKPLAELAKDPLWPVVQAHPSAVRFPGPDGEAMLDMQHRATSAIRDWNEKLGPEATYVVCSHGDVIKAIVVDALGLHLDMCQRIQADPCSLTVIRYTPLRPFVVRMNDLGGSVTDLLPRREEGGKAELGISDAAVGGGAGGTGE
jgi:probable phosphomutase (TIGR03848 family)